MLSLRLKLRLPDVELQGSRDDFLALTVVSPRRISVLIEMPEAHGLEGHGGVVALARTQLEPNDTVARGFAALADLRLPEGTPQFALLNWRRFQDASGRLKPGMVYPQAGLPPAMSSFVEQIRRDLVQAVRRSCLALRWRYALPGPHDPLRSAVGGPEWSLDSSSWYPLPGNPETRNHHGTEVSPTASVAADVQTLLDAGLDEPLAHQIFREAWDCRLANRQSALMIAVTALEVGVKAFVTQVNPAAQWLLSTLPSPPLRRLLGEYLPSLEAPGAIGGKVLPPPKAALDLIDRAVSIRSRAAQATGEEIPRDSLDEMLIAIRDVLWLLDLYGGATWAAPHISATTQAALGLPLDEGTA